jgi:uncharacterized membrane protein
MNKYKQAILYTVGVLVMTFAYFGYRSTNSDCSNTAVWPTNLYLVGTLLVGTGLFLHFHSKTKSLPRAVIFSVLIVLAILIVGIFLAIDSQSNGIFHCYTL